VAAKGLRGGVPSLSLATLLVLSLALSPAAIAGTLYSVPLPELVGVIDFLPAQPGRAASFDFGLQFSDIESVSLEIEAHVVAETFDFCGSISNPQPCVNKPQLLGFVARLDEQDHPVLGSIITFPGLNFSDDIHVPQASGVVVSSFKNIILPEWDFLLDGEGSLVLFWNAVGETADQIRLNFTDPSGEILNARLILEGTSVPEPSTALLLGAGLLVLLAGTRRWHG